MTEEFKIKLNKLIEEMKKEQDELFKNKDFTRPTLDSKEDNELHRKHCKQLKELFSEYKNTNKDF